MTKKVFYQDSHQEACEAVVLSCEAVKGAYQAVLDQTVFFPEGGGQYADTGWIGEAEVTDAHERDGIIRHTVDLPLEIGSKVTARINFEERFEKMQQHTGEHIVSGLVHEKYGYNNVGFHLGSDYCTMDFDGPITREELKEIEQEANRAVWKNLEIQVEYPSSETLARMEYRSKIEIEGQVRIITVPGYDVCACCAPHVKRTGEIGLIKLVHMINYKGGVRITMLCGVRALRDYEMKDAGIKEISTLLCAKEYDAAGAVIHMKEEYTSLKGRTVALEQKLLTFQAEEIPIEDGVTAVFDPVLGGSAPRELMNLLLERGAAVAAVFAGDDEKGYRYVIGSRGRDVRPIGKVLNDRFQGRGGGKPDMVQGSLTGAQEAVRAVLAEER